jgi:hypothetical protein
VTETVVTELVEAPPAGHYTLDPHGLVLVRPLTEDEWVTLGHTITRQVEGGQWALGDWLVYGGGQRTHGDMDQRSADGRWTGEGYARAMLITGYSHSWLSKLFTIGKTYPRGVRVVGASWAAHYAAHALPRDASLLVLERARDRHWTAADVEREVAQLQAGEVAAERDRLQETETLRAIATPRHHTTRRHLPGPVPRGAAVECPQCHTQFAIRGHRVAA